MSDSTGSSSSCGPSCGCNSTSRREFLKQSGLTAAGIAAGASIAATALSAVAGPFEPADVADHFVPVDKKLKPEWLKLLRERGSRQLYEADDLTTIAMPVGGLTTGQLYLAGDGRLMHWDIFNLTGFSGYGSTNYATKPPQPLLDQGFSLTVTTEDGKQLVRTLDRTGFPAVRFCGEYPMAFIDYADPQFPVQASLEAFSPFCPLSDDDSSLPVTVMRFTLKNGSDKPVQAALLGLLENGVARFSGAEGVRINQVVREAGWTMIAGSARPAAAVVAKRPPIVIETFEGADYGQWKVEGEAFGKGPARGTIEKQQKVSGFQGKGLVNTYLAAATRCRAS